MRLKENKGGMEVKRNKIMSKKETEKMTESKAN